MIATNHHGPALGALLRKTVAAAMGALHNRGELFLVELEEEKARMIKLMLCGVGVIFLGMMTLLLFTGTIIFLCRPEYRGYAAGGFTLLYLLGTIWAAARLNAMLREVPFAETIDQVKKDGELLEAFE